MKVNNQIALSVLMLTYNHSKFIEKAIVSVLSQNCNFIFELIIADDHSTDNTETIINNLILKHPKGNFIKYTRHSTNKGSYLNGQWILSQSSAKYIALCEGDDYWIDNNKLQIQFDFLENNLEYNLCYHDVKILKNNNELSDDFVTKTKKNITNIYDLAVWGNYIHTSSVFLRNNFSFINNNSSEYLCDYFLYMHAVNSGKIKKISSIMSVYRYGEGIWASSTSKMKYKFLIDNIHNILKTTDDDTIKEIMKMRLNSEALYQLPKYISKIENEEDRKIIFILNEKIPFSVLLDVFLVKIFRYLKKILLLIPAKINKLYS